MKYTAETAELFELPIDDPRHRQLRDDAWFGGSVFEGTYFLGKFLGTNEFCFTFDVNRQHLQECLRAHLPHVEWLLNARCFHEAMVLWLKHKYRQSKEHIQFPIPNPTKEQQAIVRVIEDPKIGDDEIRIELRCTEKTMKRWSSFQYFRIEQKRLARYV